MERESESVSLHHILIIQLKISHRENMRQMGFFFSLQYIQPNNDETMAKYDKLDLYHTSLC